jgi:hypothetical protein
MGKKTKKSIAAREDDSDNDSDHTHEPKKRGQPSNFTGQRLAFLTENIPAYIAASKKKSGKEAKTEGLAPFWAQLFTVYWTCFPWDLLFDQDPDPDAVPPPPPRNRGRGGVDGAETGINT